MSIPLSVAVPAVAASIAYLNARWFVSNDVKILSALIKSIRQSQRREKEDQVNIFHVLESWALDKAHQDLVFLRYEGRQWTYKEFYDLTLKYGSYFREEHHVKPRDIVAMVFINSPAFLLSWFGLWSIGAIPAFINYNLTGSPLVHSIQTSTARLVIIDNDLRKSFPSEVMEQLSMSEDLEHGSKITAVFHSSQVEEHIMQIDGLRYDDNLRNGVKLTDPCILISTSGTTGRPKAAIITWGKANGAGNYTASLLSLQPKDGFYTCMPLYHTSAALLGVCSVLDRGATLVLGRRFSTQTFWPEIRESKATILQYVGETCRYLLAAPPQVDPATGKVIDRDNSIRTAIGNGLRPDIWNRFKDRFSVENVCEFYGASESPSSSWNFSSNDFTAGAVGRHGSLLYALAGMKAGTQRIMKVNWETQEPLRDPVSGLCILADAGEPGEQFIKVDEKAISEMFQGYYNNQNASDSKILRDVLVKGDAWFRSGDLLMWDHEGRHYFKDRLGDTFRWKSENISTSEVSEALGAHPLVQEANVYGVSLPHHDGRVGCVALTLSGEPTSEVLHSLAQHSLKSLPRYAVPQFIRFPTETRTTGNNKQQKTELRNEGVDPSKTGGDPVFWLQDGTYRPFKELQWQQLNGGKVRL